MCGGGRWRRVIYGLISGHTEFKEMRLFLGADIWKELVIQNQKEVSKFYVGII